MFGNIYSFLNEHMASVIGLRTRDASFDVGRSAASVSKKLTNFGTKYELKTFIPPSNSGQLISSPPVIRYQTVPNLVDSQIGMFGIPLGTGDGQRIGRLVTVKEVCVTGVFYMENQGDVSDGSPLIRVIVGIDRQHNARAMDPAQDVLLSEIVGTGGDAGPFWYGMVDLGQEKRFKILADNAFEMCCTGNFPGQDKLPTAILNYSKTFKMELPVEFTVPDGYVGAPPPATNPVVQTNDFFLYMCSSVPGVKFFFEGRVRYMDDC